MAKARIKISDELAAQILFDSDKTCCVCRDKHKKIQIQHIDNNPANNDIVNLAVLCNDCHSEAHTNHAFTRNLTPQLISKYNESWKATVKVRLEVGGLDGEELEYKLQVLLEIGLIPHQWKMDYMVLYPGHFQNTGYSSEIDGGDIWDAMTECAVHPYTIKEWEKYRPLFNSSILNIIERLERMVMAYGDVLPASIKLEILRTNFSLQLSRQTYQIMPSIFEISEKDNGFLKMRFNDVIRVLSILSRLADTEREAL